MLASYSLPSEEKSDAAASKAPGEPASSEASPRQKSTTPAIPSPVAGMPGPFDFSAMSGLLNVRK